MFPGVLYDISQRNHQRLRRCYKMFQHFSETVPDVPEQEVLDLVRLCDEHCLEEALALDVNAYDATCVYNQETGRIIECSTERILRDLFAGNVDVNRFLHMTIRDSHPEKYQLLFERQKIENSKGKESQLYKCSKCKSSKITTDKRQTRAADEGVTVLCCCTNCGNRWSFRG